MTDFIQRYRPTKIVPPTMKATFQGEALTFTQHRQSDLKPC